MKASKKVFFNTIALYIKMFITIVIGLYLTRVVLNGLGVEDFGLYNLIGGIIALLSFLQTALSVSTQRFLSVAMGKKSNVSVKSIFASSLFIHIGLSLFIVLILEICSLFLFNGFLNIPLTRIDAAKNVYQIMILSTFVSIFQVPFSADITANEDLWFFSIVETLVSLLKLFIIVLFELSSNDKLILYSLWMLLTIVLAFLVKYIWCRTKYSECKQINIITDVRMECVKEMMGFTGWNSFGTLALVGRNQGVAVLINIFWGTAFNAVYGIANQVNSQLVHFSQIMTTSMAPQIMKSEGEGNRGRMLFLSVFTSKMAFFLSAVLALPLIIELDYVLKSWLKTVPDYADIYCLLILAMFLVMQLYPGLTRAIQASGIIRQYQIFTSLLLLLPIPLGFLLYKMEAHNTVVLYLMVLSQILQMIYAIYYVSTNLGLKQFDYYIFIFKALTGFILILLLGHILRSVTFNIIGEHLSFVVVVLTVVPLFFVYYYYVALEPTERDSVNRLVSSLKRK